MEVSGFDETHARGEVLLFHCRYSLHRISWRWSTLYSRRSSPRTTSIPLLVMTSRPGVSVKDYLMLTLVYALDAVVGKRRAQKHINNKNLDNSKPCQKRKVKDAYEHRYDSEYVDSFLSSSGQITAFCSFSLAAPLLGQQQFIYQNFSPAHLSTKHDYIVRVISWVLNDIRVRYVGGPIGKCQIT